GPVAVYAGTDSGGYGAVLQAGVVNWVSANALSSLTIFSIAIAPETPSTLFVGTNGGLLKSLDSGTSWQTIDPTASGLQAQQIFALLFDPVARGTLYAGTATGFYVSTDGGASWTGLYDGVGATRILSIAAGPTPILYAGANGASVYQYGKPDLTPCFSGPFALCLNGGRFRVTASWQTTDGRSGAGMRVGLTGDTGYFWFFSSDNVELVVKVLDGTGVNGHFWVFYGALSNVAYTITIRDTHTGVVKNYTNPQGNLASVADTTAFAAASTPSGAAGTGPPPRASPMAAAAGACTSGPEALCLNGSRFRADVSWRTTDGRSGSGQAVALTGDTGYFWFFSSANVELIVKVLDGRAINGHFWVFYGALSNVQYTLTVTDTETGASKPYANPQGTLASVADTAAF
ncbi:MAG: WD40/YVTN/BNR-like repeat-containing protein, partial [Syntrophomonadaceae bacterium]